MTHSLWVNIKGAWYKLAITLRLDEALALNQRRAFRLHLNRQTRVVMSDKWFQDLNAAHQGVIALAPARLRDELFAVTVELGRRHRLGVDRLRL